MTKSDIITQLVIETGIKKSRVLMIVDGFLDAIKEASYRNEQVDIRGFGTFNRTEKKARKLNSPIAGGTVTIPAKSVLSFKPSKITEREL